MSGRRRVRSDGSPIGNTGGTGGTGRSVSNSVRSVSGSRPMQQAQLVDILGYFTLHLRNLGAGAVELSACIRDIELGRETDGLTLASEVIEFFLRSQAAVRHVPAQLCPAQLDVVASHIRAEGHEHGVLIFDRSLQVRVRRLHGTPDTAEQIDFPGSAGSELELVVGVWKADWTARPESGRSPKLVNMAPVVVVSLSRWRVKDAFASACGQNAALGTSRSARASVMRKTAARRSRFEARAALDQ